MVFYNDRKRRHRGQQQKAKPTLITDLPKELLLDIIDHSSTTDVLRLRGASKPFVGVCTDTLRKRLRVLYVHPSASSLRKAIKICQSDLSSDIEEVCFVNKVMWHTIRQQENAGRHLEAIDIAATWPSSNSKQGKKSDQSESSHFAGAYSVLLSALADLPNIQSFSFTDTCDKPGFNMLPKSRIFEYAEALQPVVLSKEHQAENKLYRRRDPTPSYQRDGFTDTEAVLAILSHFRITFKHLRITDELPYAHDLSYRCTRCHHHPAFRSCQSKLANLTSLELHCNTGWDRTFWHDTCHDILSLAAPKLQRLKLAFQHNAAVRRVRVEQSLQTLFTGLDFPKLTHLDLLALHPSPRNGRHYRPICQEFDLVDFLSTHTSTLQLLTISNILFSAPTSPTPRPLLQQTRDLLDTCRVLGVRLSWIVNYFEHDPRCEATRIVAARCLHGCATYSPPGVHGSVRVENLEGLAAELGVERDGERWVWEFGGGLDGG